MLSRFPIITLAAKSSHIYSTIIGVFSSHQSAVMLANEDNFVISKTASMDRHKHLWLINSIQNCFYLVLTRGIVHRQGIMEYVLWRVAVVTWNQWDRRRLSRISHAQCALPLRILWDCVGGVRLTVIFFNLTGTCNVGCWWVDDGKPGKRKRHFSWLIVTSWFEHLAFAGLYREAVFLWSLWQGYA